MMKTAFNLTTIFLFIHLSAAAQDAAFRVEVSSDSLLMGNSLRVAFILENGNAGDFEAPPFEGFDLVSGPNFSSSFSMINGKVSQQISYTYYLQPRDIGDFYIEPASIVVEDRVLETGPVPVAVLPNPNGIEQAPAPTEHFLPNPWEGFDWPNMRTQPEERARPEKKKRKTYKI